MKFDIDGFQGLVLHYGLIITFVGAAFLLFIYCWYKGRLDMDDEPALRMMQMSDERPQEENNHDSAR